jgi:soluble cytochrome b562
MKKSTKTPPDKPDVQDQMRDLSAAYGKAAEGLKLMREGKMKEAKQAQREAEKLLKTFAKKHPGRIT